MINLYFNSRAYRGRLESRIRKKQEALDQWKLQTIQELKSDRSSHGGPSQQSDHPSQIPEDPTLEFTAADVQQSIWDLEAFHRDYSIQQKPAFLCLQYKQYVGIASILFLRRELVPFLSQISTEIVGTGFMKTMGNKGGIGLSLNMGWRRIPLNNVHFPKLSNKTFIAHLPPTPKQASKNPASPDVSDDPSSKPSSIAKTMDDFYSVSLCFVVSHLAAGSKFFKRRLEDYSQIMTGLSFPPERKFLLTDGSRVSVTSKIWAEPYVPPKGKETGSNLTPGVSPFKAITKTKDSNVMLFSQRSNTMTVVDRYIPSIQRQMEHESQTLSQLLKSATSDDAQDYLSIKAPLMSKSVPIPTNITKPTTPKADDNFETPSSTQVVKRQSGTGYFSRFTSQGNSRPPTLSLGPDLPSPKHLPHPRPIAVYTPPNLIPPVMSPTHNKSKSSSRPLPPQPLLDTENSDSIEQVLKNPLISPSSQSLSSQPSFTHSPSTHSLHPPSTKTMSMRTPETGEKMKVQDHDIIFFSGDLNFRIQEQIDYVHGAIQAYHRQVKEKRARALENERMSKRQSKMLKITDSTKNEIHNPLKPVDESLPPPDLPPPPPDTDFEFEIDPTLPDPSTLPPPPEFDDHFDATTLSLQEFHSSLNVTGEELDEFIKVLALEEKNVEGEAKGGEEREEEGSSSESESGTEHEEGEGEVNDEHVFFTPHTHSEFSLPQLPPLEPSPPTLDFTPRDEIVPVSSPPLPPPSQPDVVIDAPIDPTHSDPPQLEVETENEANIPTEELIARKRLDVQKLKNGEKNVVRSLYSQQQTSMTQRPRHLEHPLAFLIENDELSGELKRKRRITKTGDIIGGFQGFHEGTITFLPTYKLNKGTAKYYRNPEKPRVPSYTDRILWANGEELRKVLGQDVEDVEVDVEEEKKRRKEEEKKKEGEAKAEMKRKEEEEKRMRKEEDSLRKVELKKRRHTAFDNTSSTSSLPPFTRITQPSHPQPPHPLPPLQTENNKTDDLPKLDASDHNETRKEEDPQRSTQKVEAKHEEDTFLSPPRVELLFYHSFEFSFISDHFPVFGIFSLTLDPQFVIAERRGLRRRREREERGEVNEEEVKELEAVCEANRIEKEIETARLADKEKRLKEELEKKTAHVHEERTEKDEREGEQWTELDCDEPQLPEHSHPNSESLSEEWEEVARKEDSTIQVETEEIDGSERGECGEEG
ncbi:hypothetical protein BLNAU_1249 [Blattamonas nauphoetae]|uniref:Inositol polyphosphate-related phosphatase domain-containing protein n=1 Tax=Blattamonas nauphoetae TaxID=2049346 RepID=A0ABQ9YIV4_9EUKA|nr:hypothetical protein BLNAU_1249 [Blattamonas nauphoetae]